ncbi:TetR/AcrR family transcriptional regulator [Oceanobacillus bengalensis]|uniref:TetR/AcrR family transcriptional regulator n=1 Tax=Oceanobacillus bengalensis TaxID=1435466 RepID=A0A494Z2M9_9BACI|nr:TetR/AcrR family transcriptional regulator [Oceanobacillus bengalensis]RKQ16780.1 TetR/AcrR family transcriptional regulator [Oceanobacillus bengalensis]
MARERKFSSEELFQVTKQLLLNHGYEGFTFSLLANRIKVSRGAIYKYFENKEELISEYLIYEMNRFLIELRKIEERTSFNEQFDYLVDIIFKDSETLQIREIALHIPESQNQKVKNNTKQLGKLHLDMYSQLQSFIQQGRKEGILNPNLPDSLILGFIFQTVAIPNHYQVPESKWIRSIKTILRNGIT